MTIKILTKVADHPLNCMKVDDTGTLICVGAADGLVIQCIMYILLVLANVYPCPCCNISLVMIFVMIGMFLCRSASLIQLDNSLASCSKLDRTNANDMFDR